MKGLMLEKVYTFYSSDRERDNAEAQKYLAMASEKAKQYPYHLEFENNKLVSISYRE